MEKNPEKVLLPLKRKSDFIPMKKIVWILVLISYIRPKLTPMENSGNGTPPKSWMVESILVTLLCCLPLGIAGIVNASKVESAFYAGNVDLANDYAAKAKKWCLFGVIGSLVGAFLYIVFIVLLGLIA